MFRPFHALAALTFAAGIAAALPAAAQSPLTGTVPDNPDAIVARIGDAEITAGDVAQAYGELPQEYRQLPMAVLFPQLLDQLINRQLMLQQGLVQKLDEDAGIRADIDAYRDFLIQKAYLDRYLAKNVTEDMLRAEYDATTGKEEGKPQVKASHILLQSEDDAKAIIKELGDGADFAQLARDKSTGPSASQGGDLGYFNREQMVAPFADAAFAMDEGETSAEPVKTQFGWHVIKVTGKRTQPPPSFEDVRGQIEDRLTRDVLEAHMAELREATPVEKFNPDGTPMAKDGAEGK
ncbi:MAG: peptidylprolyl isomerase [Alphaproteobacteria bacterium]